MERNSLNGRTCGGWVSSRDVRFLSVDVETEQSGPEKWCCWFAAHKFFLRFVTIGGTILGYFPLTLVVVWLQAVLRSVHHAQQPKN